MKVAYHDPATWTPSQYLRTTPQRREASGGHLVEFKNNRLLAKCCGEGGVKGLQQRTLGRNRFTSGPSKALDAGAEVVVSACPACKSNLALAAARLRKEKKGPPEGHGYTDW